ncbi:hypothetical protein NC651_011061 [Populus alba x Populus x berolinensis]|nr:hypothetical protein NC651_011061 [Populus alba x Populus x berolinensis]
MTHLVKRYFLIDGIVNDKLQLKWLRSQIGLESEEAALFATTIKESILLCRKML